MSDPILAYWRANLIACSFFSVRPLLYEFRPKLGFEIGILTLLISSYFGPTLYTKRGHLIPPTISSTLGCTNVKFCKILEIPFKVSENTRFVKNLLYGYHGNCLITWCFLLIIVKTNMKNR